MQKKRQTDRQTNGRCREILTGPPTDRETDSESDKQANKQTDRKTVRQILENTLVY